MYAKPEQKSNGSTSVDRTSINPNNAEPKIVRSFYCGICSTKTSFPALS
jgi:hypothetical protein